MSSLKENKTLVRRFFTEMEAGRIDDAVALFSPDATFWAPSARQEIPIAEFGDALRWVNSRLQAPMRYEIGPMTAEENRVCVRAESHATTVEGMAYDNIYHFYFEVADGKIHRGREYCDTALIWRTLRAES